MSAVGARAVVGVTVVLLVTATAVSLARTGSRVIGTNGITPAVFALQITPGARACQETPPLPAGTSAIRMTLGTYGRAGTRVGAEVPGEGSGRSVPARNGVNELSVSFKGPATQLCIANLGSGPVAVAGTASQRSSGASVGHRRADGVFSALYLKRHGHTWGDRAGVILARLGYAKGALGGSLTGIVLLILLLVTLLGALGSSWRFLRP